MKLFSRSYTAQEVHDSLENLQTQLLDKVQEVVVANGGKESLESNIHKLIDCGFVNSKNLKALKEKKRLLDVINLYSRVHATFGNTAMFISFSDFEYVLRKYKLVCGKLDEYIGVIPDDKLAEIDAARIKLSNIRRGPSQDNYFSSSIKELYEVSGVSDSLPFSLIDSLRLFPFVMRTGSYGTYRYFTANNTEVSFNDIKIASFDAINMCIAAPANEMTTSLKLFKKVITRDPFVFSYTELGIIIYSKWGTESEDEVLKKYDFLNPM